MNIKVLAGLTVLSFLLTFLLFLFFPASNESQNQGLESDGSLSVSAEVPVSNPEEPPKEGNGKLTGSICVNSGILTYGVTVVAESIPSKERTTKYIKGPIDETIVFDLELPPGKYEVYSELSQRRKFGLYSEYVLCQESNKPICNDHRMIEIGLVEGATVTDVDICDYAWLTR